MGVTPATLKNFTLYDMLGLAGELGASAGVEVPSFSTVKISKTWTLTWTFFNINFLGHQESLSQSGLGVSP